MHNKINLAKQIKYYRKAHSLTQEQLAERLVSVGALSRRYLHRQFRNA